MAMTLADLKGLTVGACVSGGLDSRTIAKVMVEAGVNVVAFSAMAGVVGGGGLGNLAIIRGYNRFQSDVTLVATLIILVIVFVSQLLCNLLAKRLQH